MDDYASSVPELSVLVTTRRGKDHLGTCLRSLATQTLDPARFEVVLVQHGSPGAVAGASAEMTGTHPALTVRTVSMTGGGTGEARNVALQAARGEHVTFVDDTDWVGEAFLERLLGAAAPGVVPVTTIAHVPRDTSPGATTLEPSWLDHHYARRIAQLAGETAPAAALADLLAVGAAKLVPREVAQSARYDESLPDGEDFTYWLRVFAAHPFRVRVLRAGRAATYFRAARRVDDTHPQDGFESQVTPALDRLAEMTTVERTSPRVADVALGMGVARVAPVNAWLRSHPDQHLRVVGEVRRRGLYAPADVPWSAINHGLAEHLALLYCFTPYLDTSALVAARRMRERGWVTDVVSHRLDEVRALDPSSGVIAAEVIDRSRILGGRAELSRWGGMRDFAARALDAVDELEAERGRGYRSVYSRAMAVNSHYAAAALKLRQPGIRWIAEMSDPLLRNPLGQDRANDVEDDWLFAELRGAVTAAGFPQPDEVRALFAWAELVPYALADEIIFTNELQRDFMLDHLPARALAERARSVSRVSHHPTLPAAYYAMVDAEHELSGPDVVDIGYFGVFYASRGLTDVISALRSISLADRRHVRLHVFTDRYRKLAEEVLRDGLADVIRVRPYLPYLSFLNLTTKLDALLVNDASTTGHHAVNPYLPSKMSDYRGSGTPIWSIVEPGSMLSREQTTYSSMLGDVDGARAVLAKMIRDHVTAPLPPTELTTR